MADWNTVTDGSMHRSADTGSGDRALVSAIFLTPKCSALITVCMHTHRHAHTGMHTHAYASRIRS